LTGISVAALPAPPTLARRMKVVGALLLTLSSVTPAASVYVIIPGILQQAGTGAFLSLAAAALVGLAMAFVYAELASAHPLAGGEYAIFGRTLGPFAGFVYMGMNTFLCTFAPAVLSLGASAYLTAVWPQAPSVPIAIAIIALATLLGILNIRTNAVVTGLFLAVEIVVLIVLAGLGFSHLHRGMGELITHPVALTAGRLVPAPVAMIGLATAVAIFAYNGFGSAVYFSEEMVGAPRRVARTILIALVLTVLFEFVPTIAVLLGAPDLKSLIASQSPFSDFMLQRGGARLEIAVSLGVALAIVNAVIAIVLINARFFYSSGRDRAWHGGVNAALTRLHPRFHSPWVANLAAGAVGIAACFIPFHLLLVLNGTGVVVMYALLCLGAIAGRRTGSTAHGPYRMPLYPLAPVLGLAALVYVLYANWMDPAVGRPSLIATLLITLAAIAYYLALRRRRGGAWAMTGPLTEDEG
jgi:amino acid transporter